MEIIQGGSVPEAKAKLLNLIKTHHDDLSDEAIETLKWQAKEWDLGFT